MSPRKQKQISRQNSKPTTTTNTKLIAASHSETFIGPIPSPKDLAQYEQLQPGLAERIIQMAEREQQHRFETTKVDEERKNRVVAIAESESKQLIRAQTWGQLIGLLISLSCIGCGFASFYLGADWKIVCGFLAIPTASLILAFMPKAKNTSSGSNKEVKEEKKQPTS